MTWGYAASSSSEGPRLVFGVDGTDYLAMTLTCDPVTGVVMFDVPLGEGYDASAVSLRSGGVAGRYEPVVPPEADSYDVAHFQTDRADPVLRRFTSSGRLAIDVYGAFVSHDAKRAAERVAVAAFARACRLS